MLTLARSISLAILAWMALLGSSSGAVAEGETGGVSGTITLDGRPLADGRVFFFIDDEQFVGAKVKDGAYKIDRVPVGVHTVRVESKGVPPKYSAKSTLRAQVTEKGPNIFDFNLTAK